MNRTLEDNGFSADDKPNHYSKRISDGRYDAKIQISNSKQEFKISVFTGDFATDRLLEMTEKFSDFERVNKAIRCLNNFYGMSIDEIKAFHGFNDERKQIIEICDRYRKARVEFGKGSTFHIIAGEYQCDEAFNFFMEDEVVEFIERHTTLRNTHSLKILPEFFEPVVDGRKTFEVRYNDRDFQVGDILNLREFNNGEYTGASFDVEVTYILGNPKYCLENWVTMGIKPKEVNHDR